ncbi:MAG TPA: hypothetical protein VKB93_24965 [Thermoanaerobaculia bacterium]|nr:hypothetical protein [Thermoanaerobaculia bacterium]
MPNPQWWFELYKAGLVLAVTFGAGQFIVASWQMKNKRRELDIVAATQFQQVYGEYKEIWRLWKVYQDPDKEKFKPSDGTWWELIKRATAAEAKVEAISVKLAVERRLSDEQIQNLGLFRQGFQQLRQGIREGDPMKYNYTHPEYQLFNRLAAEVACMLLNERHIKTPSPGGAATQLKRLVAIRQEDWRNAVGESQPQVEEKRRAECMAERVSL